MEVKQLEIRDRATCIPALAIKITGADGWLCRRAGFGSSEYVLLTNLEGSGIHWDPFRWNNGSRTMRVAHAWILENWEGIVNEQVVDVQFILGEVPQPTESDRPLWEPKF